MVYVAPTDWICCKEAGFMFGFRRIIYHRTIALIFGVMLILSTYFIITIINIHI